MATFTHKLAAAMTIGVASALIAACGGGGSGETVEQQTHATGSPQSAQVQQPLSGSEQHGRDLFVSKCGSCHTLDAAGTTGQIGPNLGDIPRTQTEVLAAIERGGGQASKGAGGQTGSMPRNLVTGKDAQDVAKFVADSGPGAGN